jgi:hypothetical protein
MDIFPLIEQEIASRLHPAAHLFPSIFYGSGGNDIQIKIVVLAKFG